jgi:peptide/nickel transport system permease protein
MERGRTRGRPRLGRGPEDPRCYSATYEAPPGLRTNATTTSAPHATAARPARRGFVTLRALLGSPSAASGLVFLVVVCLLALFAPLAAPYDPEYIDPAVRLAGPSGDHWFGTDDLGRDVFSRLVYGGRISLLVGAGVALVAAVVGATLGLLAGYYRRLDGVVMRTMEGFMAFPGVLLAIAVVVSFGPHTWSVIVALTLVYMPIVARLVRGTTLVIRRLPYTESARAIGLPDSIILRRYVVANAVSPLIVQCTFIIAYAMLAEASLSYLGASVDPETPTWGNMLRDGQRLLSRAPWIGVFPGVALFLTVFALILVGEALRDALDPRSTARGRRERGEGGR